MTPKQHEKLIDGFFLGGKILLLIVFVVISFRVFTYLFIDEDGWVKTKVKASAARTERILKQRARFPKPGDTVELDGVNIVILKVYFWSNIRRYEVRLPDGSITDVLGSEIIDKKPIR